jgi:CHAD domain-containing protein
MGAASIFSEFDRLHTELAEAVLACRADAGAHAVHSLRTGTRKLEAVLRKVLEDHPGATQLHKASKKTRRELKRIRRAAGPVRDLDVQGKLAEELRDHSRRTGQASKKTLASDYEHLDRRLQQRRKRAAAKLEKVLRRNEVQLEAALEDTAKAMAHLGAASPPPLETARRWARKSSLPSDGNFEDNLHGYRKQTKQARYLAGLEQDSAPARRLAKSLKAMQDSIGRWHDLMLLTGEAAKIFGKRSALTRTVRAERDRALKFAEHSARTRLNRRPASHPASAA